MDLDSEILDCEMLNSEESSDDSGEDFDLDTDTIDLQESKNKSEEYPFEILSTEQLVQYMIDIITEVNTVIEIPATITRILLNHFKWDKQKLMEKYFDGDRDKLFGEVGIVNHAALHVDCVGRTRQSNNPISEMEDCEICLMTRPMSMMADMQCGHCFCLDCWNDYLTTKIMDEGVGQTLACAAHKCDILVDDASVMKLVKDPEVKLKYQTLITNHFVECNKLLRWCSTPGCDMAIKVQYLDAKPVTCKCNGTICFACGEIWHDPISCQMLREWTKQSEVDTSNAKWIINNTKECQKCYASIEKNGGCNHMRCRKCNYSFCWICLKPWDLHPSGSYSCNKFDETGTDPSKTRRRYLFYHLRYMTHRDSLKLEYQLYAKVNEKMEEMQQQNMTWIEVQFLKKAVDVLRSSRRTLMYTYAFAFYLKKTNQTAIFEDNQKDLEFSVETLSGYLERDIVDESLDEIKQTVVDKTSYCESRIKALLEHVHEGFEQDWWKYGN